MYARSWLVALALLAGCGKGDKPSNGAGSASGAPPPPPAADTVEVFVNDASVVKVDKAKLAEWPRLDTLVPEEDRRLGTWQLVQIKSAKSTEVPKPSANYPSMVPALFPGEGGAPAFGMFDPVELAKHGKPGLREDGVREIRIKVSTEGRGGDHQGSMGESDPAKLIVTVKSAAGETKLTGTQIIALARTPQPGSPDTQGWTLVQLLEAAGVKKLDKVVVFGAGGASVVLEKAELEDKNTVPFIKLNRQGSLRLRIIKKSGEGWQPTGDLRSIESIQVGK